MPPPDEGGALGGEALDFQTQLAGRRWRAKQCRIECVARRTVEVQTLTGDTEAGAQKFRKDARALHAGAEARIVVATTAHVPNQRHHVCGALRVMLLEPFTEQILD